MFSRHARQKLVIKKCTGTTRLFSELTIQSKFVIFLLQIFLSGIFKIIFTFCPLFGILLTKRAFSVVEAEKEKHWRKAGMYVTISIGHL